MGKNIISAAKKTILTFATLHIAILTYLSLINMDFSYLNVFNILDLQVLFPGIDQGVQSYIFSVLIVSLIFVFYLRKKKG